MVPNIPNIEHNCVCALARMGGASTLEAATANGMPMLWDARLTKADGKTEKGSQRRWPSGWWILPSALLGLCFWIYVIGWAISAIF